MRFSASSASGELCRLVDVVELAPRVRPAGRFFDRMLRIGLVEQPSKPA